MEWEELECRSPESKELMCERLHLTLSDKGRFSCRQQDEDEVATCVHIWLVIIVLSPTQPLPPPARSGHCVCISSFHLPVL